MRVLTGDAVFAAVTYAEQSDNMASKAKQSRRIAESFIVDEGYYTVTQVSTV